MLIRRSPHRLPAMEEVVSAVIEPEPGAFELSEGRSRARFYEWVAEEAAERTLRARKRLTFAVTVQVDPAQHTDQDLERMARNVEERSGRRILASHVKVIRSGGPAERLAVKVDAVAGVVSGSLPGQ